MLQNRCLYRILLAVINMKICCLRAQYRFHFNLPRREGCLRLVSVCLWHCSSMNVGEVFAWKPMRSRWGLGTIYESVHPLMGFDHNAGEIFKLRSISIVKQKSFLLNRKDLKSGEAFCDSAFVNYSYAESFSAPSGHAKIYLAAMELTDFR